MTSSRATVPAKPPEQTNNVLGQRLAAMRKLNGWSLEHVATRAGITKSYLSKLERGLSSPTIATVLKLAQALQVNAEQLISETAQAEEVLLVKASERVPFSRPSGREGYTYEAIAVRRTDKTMMPFVMWPPTRINDKKDLVSHAGEELIFLISGEMEVVFADRVIKLEEGDSLYFNGSIPHRSRSLGDVPAKALVVVTDPARRFKISE